MGYWSVHPMGGDTPMDLEYDLLGRYNRDNGETCYYELEHDELAALIKKDLKILIEDAETHGNFTLPFIIVNSGIKSTTRQARALKRLIGDGGNGDRGYESGKRATLANNWNNLARPIDYCDQLRYYFNGIVSGKVDKNVLERCKGLLETIATNTKTNKCVNVE